MAQAWISSTQWGLSRGKRIRLLITCPRTPPLNNGLRGIYSLDGKDYEVGPGNAMLTRPGSTHGIRQAGEEDLVLLITCRSKDSE